MSAVLKRLVALLALMLALGLCGLAESPELDLTDAEEPALMVETVEPQTDETELELEEAWSEYSPEHSLAAASVTVRLGVGEKYAIPTVEGAGDPTYSSKNKKIATVSTAGVIKGRKKGKTTVTATSGGGGGSVRYVVTVAKAPKSISFSSKKQTLYYDVSRSSGDSVKLKPRLSKGSSSRITYSGYDPAVVSVAGDGTLTAVGVGTTKVTARTFNKKKATLKIVVKETGQNRRVKSVAHKGSAHWEPNSLEAFRNFASTGADAVELDVRSTRDGVQAVCHDEAVIVDGVSYAIAEQDWATLKALKPTLCTLDEALAVLATTTGEIHMDLKQNADGRKCVKLVKAHGLRSRTRYFSFYAARVKEVHAADSAATLGLTLLAGTKADSPALIKKAKKYNVTHFIAHESLITQAVVDYWHREGIQVSVWTINDRETVEAMCALGVDYIVSDYPELCVEAQS